MGERKETTKEEKQEEQPVEVVEVPINLELINRKLNHIIAVIEELRKK